MNNDETIAAIATPPGEGGLSVIRISGADAVSIADKIFKPGSKSVIPSRAQSHTVHYGHVIDHHRIVDEVLLTVFLAPRTFTRENTIEISCHGGTLVTRLVLETVLRHGARLATPGEFTKRAFLNGRLDLTQAEAVAELIASRTERSLAVANQQLQGKLSIEVNRIRDDLMLVLAHVEAHIDFPEEDISPDTRDSLSKKITRCSDKIRELLNTAHEGQILRNGVQVAIVGRPNAGKSSLLNQLLGKDRAIVSSIAGTTRDTIEETANISDIPVVFTDTAGLRDSEDPLEAEGIRRSQLALEGADIILEVIDLADGTSNNSPVNPLSHQKHLVVFNKCDLTSSSLQHKPGIKVSCKTGYGLQMLKSSLVALALGGSSSPIESVPINARHEQALAKASEALNRVQEGFTANISLEFIALDLRLAVGAIGEVVGKTSTDDLLDAIFSQFCLGK